MLHPAEAIDSTELRRRFDTEIRPRIPHLKDDPQGIVVNATPLVDITAQVLDCARGEFGLDLTKKSPIVFGKFDSEIYGGSIKVRPAVKIIEHAIESGSLATGKIVFEATSGNFGIALGIMRSLGLDVIALVSRKLQAGVLAELEKAGVNLVNLDIDICPAPGLQFDTNFVMAQTVASNIRVQLTQLGLSPNAYDAAREEIEQLLAKQDVINLAKLLARIYDGFCPEQYDNELNAAVHETVTGPELDQQLTAWGHSLAEFKVVCSFGTGGTSTGVARYLKSKHGKKGVHVVFPLGDQEVGGIRTREKAIGLKFYRPELYEGEHEVDFHQARRVLRFFVERGYNIGESSALGIYACMQMINYGASERYVVMIADRIQKYRQNLETAEPQEKRYEVTQQKARTNLGDYDEILWTHTTFAPKEEGIKVIAASLGCDERMVRVAQPGDVQSAVINQEITETMKRLLERNKGKVLLVCMVGSTSLKLAKLLTERGIDAESLAGGIMGVPEAKGRHPSELVELAMQ